MDYKKQIIALTCCLFTSLAVMGGKFKVLMVNSDGIKIGGKKATSGMVFDSQQNIVWGSNKQAIKVMEIKTGRVFVIPSADFKKKKVVSLRDYLTKNHHLSTRGIQLAKTDERYKDDETFYLFDTLFVDGMKRKNPVRIKVEWKNGNQTITKILKKDTQNKKFIITRDILDGYSVEAINVDIKEYDELLNWEYYVYKGLKIIILPL